MKIKPSLGFTLSATAIAFTIGAVPFVFIDPGSSGVSVQGFADGSNSLETEFESMAAPVYVQLTGFDPELERATLAYYIWPTPDLALRQTSSVKTKAGFELMVDSHEGVIHRFEPGDQIGAIKATSDVLSYFHPEYSSDVYFPFDRYVLDTYAQIKFLDPDSGELVPIQTVDLFYEAPVPGFDVRFERLAAFDIDDSSDPSASLIANILSERAEGKISFFAFFERSTSVKMVAIFSYGFMVVVAIIVALVASRMLRSREKATINSLIWASASVLGMLQLRSMMPGDPRIGILADYLFYFPALALVLYSMVALTYAWASKSNSPSTS